MSQRGSLINHLAANSKHKFEMPKVGDGVTFYSWTDRSAGTVVKIEDEEKKIIAITHDKATRTDNNGMSECQSYKYETRWDANPSHYRWNEKKSQWEGVYKNDNGRWVKSNGQTISIGERMAYHDYSF